jgi:2-keto-4-pentenoate hydratase/2-oxohepta-3-ene-1,7-dioic acid hydratase in catechol pathway
MKLIRFGLLGRERPGVQLGDGTRVDCSGFGGDWDEAFFENDGDRRLRMWLNKEGLKAPRVERTVRLGPALARPSKIVCIGLNYLDHIQETKAKTPTEPVFFLKATTALCGPDDDVMIPRGGTKLDYEIELGIVIGKRARYVSTDKALDHVFGFVLHNDYSERAFQLERGGQWVKGKSCDTFAPLGPFVASLDEVPDFQRLSLGLKVNGEMRQHSNTENMVFDVPTLVSYTSQFMTLLPGDVISTGTPAGVGLGFDPPRFLKEGDIVECAIEKLGVARQRVGRER